MASLGIRPKVNIRRAHRVFLLCMACPVTVGRIRKVNYNGWNFLEKERGREEGWDKAVAQLCSINVIVDRVSGKSA